MIKMRGIFVFPLASTSLRMNLVLCDIPCKNSFEFSSLKTQRGLKSSFVNALTDVWVVFWMNPIFGPKLWAQFLWIFWSWTFPNFSQPKHLTFYLIFIWAQRLSPSKSPVSRCQFHIHKKYKIFNLKKDVFRHNLCSIRSCFIFITIKLFS
jgi:hypothetical protein